MKNALFASILCLYVSGIYAQNRYNISGLVKDSLSGENLSYATISDTLSKEGIFANDYGFYSLSLAKGKHVLAFAAVGYATKYYDIDLQQNISKSVALLTDDSQTDTVKIMDNSTRNAQYTGTSSIRIPIQQIQKMPSVLGEPDVMKALQLLPGVQFGQEGTAGLYVRGGSPDQNLVLLDEMPVYNVTHLFGFFSLFSPDAVKSVELIKGGFAPEYGGRLSSVIVLQTKEGNMKQWKKHAHIGFMSSGVSVEGPILKDKISCFISVRRSFVDAFIRPATRIRFLQEGGIGSVGYNFYDAIVKTNIILSPKDRIYMSFYMGNDKFSTNTTSKIDTFTYKGSNRLTWGNLTGSIRYQRIINNKLFANITTGYTQYNYNTRFQVKARTPHTNIGSGEVNFQSNIADIVGKQSLSYFPTAKHTLKMGMEETYKRFLPSANWVVLQGEDSVAADSTFQQEMFRSYTHALYIQDEFIASDRLSMSGGLRAEYWTSEGLNRMSLQPRYNIRYLFSDNFSIKGSYSLIYQYLHLLSSNGIGLPNDVWVPATARVPAAYSHQYVLGIYKDIHKSIYLSIEGYYKTLRNVIDYKEAASSAPNEGNWQDKIRSGKGTAYGIELFAHKPEGKWNGWISYTLAWNQRQILGINEGKAYPFRYDRRHNISVYVSRELGKPTRNISATWVFVSGYKTTLPTEIYNVPAALNLYAMSYENYLFFGPQFQAGNVAGYGSGRNNFSLRPFHKLDISYQTTKRKAKSERTWAYGIYNIYGRRNPYYLYLDRGMTRNANGIWEWTSKLKEYSFMMWIPSVSYTVHF